MSYLMKKAYEPQKFVELTPEELARVAGGNDEDDELRLPTVTCVYDPNSPGNDSID